jgi:proteasome lid subunit RPN8/RPN11
MSSWTTGSGLLATIVVAVSWKTTATFVITAKKRSVPTAQSIVASVTKCIAPAARPPANSVASRFVIPASCAAARAAAWLAAIALPKTFVPPAMKHNLTKKKRKIWKPTSPQIPSLRFTPTAWAKLLYLRDRGPTEVGGFAIAASDDPVLITDLQLVDQNCTGITVAFDDQAVAAFFDQQVDRGLHPEQFARIWVHTHPGKSPAPSWVDEETFERVFSRTEWSIMFILARGGQTYCRLQFHVGPGGAVELPVEIEYRQPFTASDQPAWEAEYLAKVRPLPGCSLPANRKASGDESHELIAAVLNDAPSYPGVGGDVGDHFEREANWYDF